MEEGMRTGTTRFSDPFFAQDNCDRCGAPLPARIMSWFTNAVICMACSDKESVIKKALRAKGIEDAMEGCGRVPVEGRDY
jgi:hypothetical protein